jgi:quercetin dioxygenase-like cupin family protein
MPETLKIGPREEVVVIEDTPDVFLVEATYGPSSSPPPPHFHPSQDERFEVLEGAVCVRLDGEERRLEVGDVVEVPRTVPHQFWNPTDAPSRVRWETRPALRTAEWFRTWDALHRAGKVDANGRPKPHHLAALVTEYRDVFRLAGPAGLLAEGMRVVAPLGRGVLDDR